MHVVSRLKLLKLLVVHFELSFEGCELLLSTHGVVAPVINDLKVRAFDRLGVRLEFNFADVWEIGMCIPIVVVVHGLNHLFEFLDALLEVTELINAELFDHPLLQSVFLN